MLVQPQRTNDRQVLTAIPPKKTPVGLYILAAVAIYGAYKIYTAR